MESKLRHSFPSYWLERSTEVTLPKVTTLYMHPQERRGYMRPEFHDWLDKEPTVFPSSENNKGFPHYSNP